MTVRDDRVEALARFLFRNYPVASGGCCRGKRWADIGPDCRDAWLDEASTIYGLAHESRV